MMTTVESLRKTIGKNKKTEAFAWLADLMLQEGNLDGALECVQAGLVEYPDNETGKLVLSKILQAKEDWDGVIEACNFVLRRNPYCLSALRRQGDAFAAKGDDACRNLCYQQVHDLDPLDPFWKDEYAPKFEELEAQAQVGDQAEESAPDLEDVLKDAPPLNLPPVEGSLEVTPAESVKPEIKPEPEPLNADDPFASLSAMLPGEEDEEENASIDSLEHSLEDALAGFAPSDTEKDRFPTDEIGSDDISSALSGIFGAADDTESQMDLPTEPAKPAPKPEIKQEKPEDKPQSLSDAFDSIFGEDELPEEFIPNVSKESVKPEPEDDTFAKSDLSDFSLKGETSAAENSAPAAEEISPELAKAPTAESLTNDVSSSFDSLFGKDSDDALDDTFAKSDLGDFSLKSETPATENATPAVEESASEVAKAPTAESLTNDVSSSFDSLFGKDPDDALDDTFAKSDLSDFTLKGETPAAESATPAAEEISPELAKAPTAESLTNDVSSSFDSLFGKDSDDALDDTFAKSDLSDFSLKSETPATENAAPAVEEISPETAKAPSAESLTSDVSSSFDNLFGKDSDDALDDTFAKSDLSDFSLKGETPATENAAPAVEEISPETAKAPSAESLTSDVSSSFDSLFGKDSDDALDDTFAKSDLSDFSLKSETPATESATPAVEEISPETAKAPSAESLTNDVSSSFDSLFGKDSDDALDDTFAKSDLSDFSLKSETPAAENAAPAVEEISPESAKAPTAESLTSDVSSSFDNLFGKDSDDALDDTFAKSDLSDFSLKSETPATENAAPAVEEISPETAKAPSAESLTSDVSSSFDSLFGKDSDDALDDTFAKSDLSDFSLKSETPAAENAAPAVEEISPESAKAPTAESLTSDVSSSFDNLFGKDSDDAFIEDPATSTRTLAEIYFEQGVYDEAIKIYKDLIRKEPEDETLRTRLDEIEKIRDDKTAN